MTECFDGLMRRWLRQAEDYARLQEDVGRRMMSVLLDPWQVAQPFGAILRGHEALIVVPPAARVERPSASGDSRRPGRPPPRR